MGDGEVRSDEDVGGGAAEGNMGVQTLEHGEGGLETEGKTLGEGEGEVAVQAWEAEGSTLSLLRQFPHTIAQATMHLVLGQDQCPYQCRVVPGHAHVPTALMSFDGPPPFLMAVVMALLGGSSYQPSPMEGLKAECLSSSFSPLT